MSTTPPADDNDRTVIIPNQIRTPITPLSNSNMLPIGTKLGEFEITGLIGEGGFGIVYLAQDHSLQRKVALKEYMPSAMATRTGLMTVSVKSDRHADTFAMGLKSFVNEARLLAQFDHAALVKVYRFWEANGTAYMVMPFYEGVTLKEALRKLGSPPDEAWLKNLLRPLLDALAQMHREQCFHRDIAPDNILILQEGRPLLLDFGAARRVIGDMTQALTVILKPGYAPVEQYAEMPEMKQGAWTDIYALASVIYFAIVGKPPIASVARMMSDPMEPLSKLAAGRYSEEFLNGIDKALAVKPNERPQDIAELRLVWGLGDRRQRPRETTLADDPEAPGQSTQQSSTLEIERSAATTASRSSKKMPVALYAVAAALGIAIAGGWFFFAGKKSAATATTEPATIAPPVTATAASPTAEKPPAQPAPETISLNVPPPAPIVPDRSFSPGQMLDEIFEGRNRAHAVTASVEKAQVRVGHDHLRFTIGSSKPGYVYILVVGTNRTDFDLLFPNTADKNNRIEPGQTLKLPGPQWPMKAQGPAGTDQFVAIISDEPRDFNALGLTADDIFKKFPLDIGARLYRDYSGTKPLFAGKTICTDSNPCSDSYGATIFSIEEVDARHETQNAAPASVAPKAATKPLIADSSPTIKSNSTRCSDILQRASLGDSLSLEEQTILKRDCK